MLPNRRRFFHRAALAALLLVPTFAGCGSEPAAPQPFADVAGTYALQTVNGATLPWQGGENTWLFERRLVIRPEGRFERYEVFCTSDGEACPRRESALSGTVSRAGDGTLILPINTIVQYMGGLNAAGELVLVESYAVGGSTQGPTLRFTRR